MAGFNHILFPVDFSDRCRGVRPFVKAVAQRFHAKLTLLHAVQIPTGWYGGMDGGYPIVFDVAAIEDAAKSELNTFLEPAEGVADKVVVPGDPAFEITQFAEQNQVDLIMMPTHGYGKFRSLLLGSVTAKVLHDAKCPVWTAAHTEAPAPLKHLDCKNIMGAIDRTAESVDLLRRYVKMASELHATLSLVHAVVGGEDDIPRGLDQGFRKFLFQSAREEIAQLQAEAGTNLEVCMEGGGVATVVRNAAQHHDADLVMIGRGTLHETLGQLRTNAYAIIRDAPCPVLSV